MIIVGYQGIGKSSTVAEDRRHRFIDLESSNFWIHRKRDPEWFMIYGNIADDLSRQGFIVFVSSHASVVNYIASISHERKAIICPSLGLKDEWIDRLKSRYEQEPTNKNYKAFKNELKKDIEEVYTVTYWSDTTTEPVVTVFNNKENADIAYDYFIKSYNCCVDKCPVYENFTVKND